MYSQIIHIDGVDKTGKDTVRDTLVKKSNGNYLIYVRSFISQIAYSRLYDRKIDENFFFNRMKSDFLKGAKFFVLTCNINEATKRFKKHNEKDIQISDFETHLKMFYEVISDAKKLGIEITIIDTSKISIDNTVENIEKEIFNQYVYNCKKCDLHKKCDKNIPDINKSRYLIISTNPDIKKLEDSVENLTLLNNEVFIKAINASKAKNNFRISHLVKCNTGNNSIESYNVDDCLHNLKHELEVFKPSLIIAVGNQVFEELNRLKIFPAHNIVKIIHPTYCTTYNKMTEKKYIEHVKKAIKW